MRLLTVRLIDLIDWPDASVAETTAPVNSVTGVPVARPAPSVNVPVTVAAVSVGASLTCVILIVWLADAVLAGPPVLPWSSTRRVKVVLALGVSVLSM